MPQSSALISLILTSLVVMGSPGPSTISLTAVGAAFGYRRSVPYMIGLMAGTAAVLLAVATGVVALALASPGLAPVLVGASAVYILYLAYKIATAPPLALQDPAARAPSIAGGFLLGAANPKAYVAIAAVFVGGAPLTKSPMLDAAAKTATLTAMIVVIHLLWLIAGVSLSRALRDPAISRFVNLLFAAILVLTTALAAF